MKMCQNLLDARIAGAAFERKDSLTGGGDKFINRQAHRASGIEGCAIEPGRREECAGDLAFGNFAQSRINIATEWDDLQILPHRKHLRLPPQRTGADGRALRDLIQRHAVVADPDITRIGPRGRAGDLEPIRQRHRQVLGRVNGKVDVVGQQRFFYFFDEESFAA